MGLRIAIDARIPEGFAGGVAQVVTGLAQGFSAVRTPGLERLWVTYPGHEKWLDVHLPSGDDVVEWMSPVERVGLWAARRHPKAVSAVRPPVQRLLDALPGGNGVDASLARHRIDGVHLTFQDGLRTCLPTLYHPHDLQHRHLPQHFTKSQLRHRETSWRRQAQHARAVSVGTAEVAQDLVRFWGVPREKIYVVPLGSGAADREVGPRSRQNPPLILYPAAFWPHKDHLTLVRAVASLPPDLSVDLLLPGAPLETHAAVRREVASAGLDPERVLPGYLSAAELADAFDRASVVVVPSRFESASFPIWESFARGVPVLAADTTALPRQVGTGGLIFKGGDVAGLARLLELVLRHPDLLDQMGQAGLAHARAFTWERTALATAALYRIIAGRAPTSEESAALHGEPLL